MRSRFYLFIFLIFLAGCVEFGRDFPSVPIQSIQPNVTTKEQIFASFGEPVEKGLDTGYETWTYYRYEYGLGGVQAQKRLQITFNKDGTVRNYSYTSR